MDIQEHPKNPNKVIVGFDDDAEYGRFEGITGSPFAHYRYFSNLLSNYLNRPNPWRVEVTMRNRRLLTIGAMLARDAVSAVIDQPPRLPADAYELDYRAIQAEMALTIGTYYQPILSEAIERRDMALAQQSSLTQHATI